MYLLYKKQLRLGLTCRLFILSGVVHCLWAQQKTTLHSVWSDNWQQVRVPSLQWKPVRPEWQCNSKQELSCHCQNRYVHMYDQICTGNICATVQSILGDVQCHVEPSMTFACYLTLDMVGKQVPYKEKDMACVPKFTQPLVDRSVVAGYSTAISCAVKGFPRVNTHKYRSMMPLIRAAS